MATHYLTCSAPRRTIPSCQSGPSALPASVEPEPWPLAFLSGNLRTHTHIHTGTHTKTRLCWSWHIFYCSIKGGIWVNHDDDLLWRSGTPQALVPQWCSEFSYREQLSLVFQPPAMGWGIVPRRHQRMCFLWPCLSQPRPPHSPPPHTYTKHVWKLAAGVNNLWTQWYVIWRGFI